jgi:hypothetical protein
MILVTITLSVYYGVFGLTYDTEWTYQRTKTVEECQARKHQLEFLPPVGVNNAQVHFCWNGN